MADLANLIGSLPPDQREALKQRLVQQGYDRIAGMRQGWTPPQWAPEMATAMLPGAGDAMAMRDSQQAGQRMVDAFRAGDYGGAAGAGLEALGHGLGALPMFPAFGAMVKAYHGSPHRFDRFSMDKIGTGEGAQAYGHGLYFAENPAIAGHYASQLGRIHAGGVPEFEGFGTLKTIEDPFDLFRLGNQSEDNAIEAARGLIKRKQQQLADISAEPNPEIRHNLELSARGIPRQIEELERLIESGAKIKKPGALYNVSLDVEPEDLLDWDAPLSQQSEKVRKAVEQSDWMKEIRRSRAAGETNWTGTYRYSDPDRISGGDLYNLAEQAFGSPESASRALAEAGIPGLRYFDAGSRPTGLASQMAQQHGREKALEIARERLAQTEKSFGISVGRERAKWQDVIDQLGRPDTRNVVMFRDDLIKIEGVE
jgi:hypothetical protein